MGRGKKKDKKSEPKQEEELAQAVETLTISEPQPTTSAEAVAPPPAPVPAPAAGDAAKPEDDDDEGGLGLGLGKARRKKKKKPAAAKAAGDQPEAAAPKPTPQPTPTAPPGFQGPPGLPAPPVVGQGPVTQPPPAQPPTQPTTSQGPPGLRPGPQGQGGFPGLPSQPASQGGPWKQTGWSAPPPAGRFPRRPWQNRHFEGRRHRTDEIHGTPSYQNMGPGRRDRTESVHGIPSYEDMGPERGNRADAIQDIPSYQSMMPGRGDRMDEILGISSYQNMGAGRGDRTDAVHGIPSYQNVGARRGDRTDTVHDIPSYQDMGSGSGDKTDAIHVIPSYQDMGPGRGDRTETIHGIPSYQNLMPGRGDRTDAVHGIPSYQDKGPGIGDRTDAIHGIPSYQSMMPGRGDRTDAIHGIPSYQNMRAGRGERTGAIHGIPSYQDMGPGRGDRTDAIHGIPSYQSIMPGKGDITDATHGIPPYQNMGAGRGETTDAIHGIPSYHDMGPESGDRTDAIHGIPSYQSMMPGAIHGIPFYQNMGAGRGERTDAIHGMPSCQSMMPGAIHGIPFYQNMGAGRGERTDAIHGIPSCQSMMPGAIHGITFYQNMGAGRGERTDAIHGIPYYQNMGPGSVDRTDTIHGIASYQSMMPARGDKTDATHGIPFYQDMGPERGDRTDAIHSTPAYQDMMPGRGDRKDAIHGLQPTAPTPAGRGAGRGRGQASQASGPVGRGSGQAPQPSGPQPRLPGPPVAIATQAPSGDTRRTPPETICRYKIPDKVRGGRVQARMIRVLANYLEMNIKALSIYRYDVSFKPDKPKKFIPRAYNLAKGRHFPKSVVAFDQMKNCYSLQPLPNVPPNERFATVVEVTDNNGRNISFEVSFKATGIVNLGTIMDYMRTGGSSLNPPTEAIQCVDVILRQGTLEHYIKAGRQFFKRPDRPIDLGDGLEMWTGLFQSAIFTSRPFINIDVAHKGFPRQQLMIDALQRDFKLDLNTPIDKQRNRGVEAFMMFIKNLRVMASIGGDVTASGQKREFICNELVDPPGKIRFTMTDHKTGAEKQMTVAEYFAREKGVRLRYPNLNCMWVGPRDKKIYYPLELLEVSYGQALNKQLNEMQLSTMVREAATPPNERKRKIEEVIRDMNYSRNAYFKQFGLEISDKFLEVEAKVLAPPNIDVGGKFVTPNKGAWQANSLLKPQPLQSWAFISIELDVQRSNGENVISLLKSSGNQLGMSVAEPRERYNNIDMRRLREVLFDALGKGIKFLVIIVPTRGRDYYHRVKQLAEREIGILTQCIKEYTANRRMNPQTAKNILLKVNSKLMGINQALDRGSIPQCIAGGGVMVVGADVTHPSPDQSSVPSIAAVTASIDPKCFMYNIQLSIQTPKKEMIVEFEDMMVEHLKVYMKTNQNALPRKIFVFRDGVSEGQFAQVMNSELHAVHRAYERMAGASRKPEILFLLVQKRHHTRFFNANPNHVQYNVEPGTVVDSHIVHAKELDFYLVSHQAIKGTARPTRYHAVCNDGGIPHDEVEQLTYYLCHLYSRCMRAVSYPTPTYYAHLACLRARSLTYGEKFNNLDLEKNPKRLNVLDKMLEFSRMFFV